MIGRNDRCPFVTGGGCIHGNACESYFLSVNKRIEPAYSLLLEAGYRPWSSAFFFQRDLGLSLDVIPTFPLAAEGRNGISIQLTAS